jgi:hypothetical protein
MAETAKAAVAVVGVDIGKNSFHVVGLDRGGAIVLRPSLPGGPKAESATRRPLPPNRGSANLHIASMRFFVRSDRRSPR